MAEASGQAVRKKGGGAGGIRLAQRVYTERNGVANWIVVRSVG